jgi:hypothetical protein
MSIFKVIWNYQEFYLVRYNGEHITSIFRVEESAKQETSVKQAASKAGFMLFSCLPYCLSLKMEATSSSET